MKKSLLALVVLSLFAGVASAQSSVTIYGSLDLAVMKGNGGTAQNQGVTANANTGTFAAGGNPRTTYTKAWNLSQSNASRLGFRGNEDLGGGLSAQFQIEHRFFPDTGAQNGGVFWQGRSYVQLTSATAGSVYLGREYAPIFWPAVKSDPFGWDGVGQMGPKAFAGYTTNDKNGLASATVDPTSRTQNAVGYKSPSLGGLKIQAAVGLGEGALANGREAGFNAEYAAGPIYAALGYDRTTKGSNVATDGNNLVQAALHYDFGVAKVMGYAARAKTGTNNVNSNKYYSIGVLAPIGPGNLKAIYGRLDPQGPSNLQQKFAVGYDYFLSKRTNVYADVSQAKEDLQTNNRAVAFGVKHTF